MSKARFSVLLDDPDVLSTRVREIARVVSTALEVPISDAAQSVRYGHGILARDVLAPYAKDISRALAQLGVGSFTVESQPGESAPRAKRLGLIEARDEALMLQVRFRAAEVFPWEKVLAVHAHATIAKGTSSDEGEALPKRGGDITQLDAGVRKVLEGLRAYEDRERTGVTLGMDVIVEGNTIYRLAYDTPGLYANLDGRMASSVGNYLLLLRTLLDCAPGRVLVPPTTRRFLSRHEFTDVLFTKPEELESFNAWVLHAVRAGITYGEPEDLDDDALRDEDEALVVGGAGDDVDDIDDEDLDDSNDALEEDDDDAGADADGDDDDDGGSEGDPAEEAAGLSDDDLDDSDIGDDEVAEAAVGLSHFENTQRLEAGDVHRMLNEAETLELGEESADPDKDEEVKQAMDFFDGQSGGWDVTQLPAAAADDAGDDA